ncbi:multidrug MFS transporter [Metallosphaera tengchongensis]|uniref:Multidrug MFS transporter n=1 Tax=Metallosphaera tengchongensis TaxID=1532350 RepID=A0A6N0NSU3_9CREN|nr:3'-flap repair endonuclease Xpf [Metallosphaera tengchongensis]QKQ99913.1 multidrug MFS transporter [Metallosphaera tengchongensis]
MLRIYVDTREAQSGIPDLLRENGVTVFFQQLSVGDYVIAQDVVIERKNVFDLLSSIFDKRFFDQLARLKTTYLNTFLLIEGSLEAVRSVTEKWKILNSALVSAAIDYDAKIIYSANKKDSADVILSIIKRYQNGTNNKGPIVLHDKPKFETIDQIQLYVVESLPRVGGKTAVKLLTEFNTIKDLCNSSVADIEKAIGSRKTAELIYKIFNTPYSTRQSNKISSLSEFIDNDKT